MNLLKKQLITALTLKSINYYKNAGDIVLAVNASDYRWEVILMQYAADSK